MMNVSFPGRLSQNIRWRLTEDTLWLLYTLNTLHVHSQTYDYIDIHRHHTHTIHTRDFMLKNYDKTERKQVIETRRCYPQGWLQNSILRHSVTPEEKGCAESVSVLSSERWGFGQAKGRRRPSTKGLRGHFCLLVVCCFET